MRCTYSEASVILSGVFRFVLRIGNAQSKDPSLLDPEQCLWEFSPVSGLLRLLRRIIFLIAALGNFLPLVRDLHV